MCGHWADSGNWTSWIMTFLNSRFYLCKVYPLFIFSRLLWNQAVTLILLAFDAFSIYERFVCISMHLKLFSPPTGITLASLVVERPQYPPCAVPKGWEDKLIVAPTPRNNFIRHSETAVVRLVSCHFNYRIKHCLPDILSNFLSV